MYESTSVEIFFFRFSFYLKSIVCPAAEFHVTFLIVKRKPRDIDFACTFENTRRYENAATVTVHYNVSRIRTVETFVSAETHTYTEYY